jgi:glycosyltransferase involved in cell wall biosynthesis
VVTEIDKDGRSPGEVDRAFFDPESMVEIHSEIFEFAASSGPGGLLLYAVPALVSILFLIATRTRTPFPGAISRGYPRGRSAREVERRAAGAPERRILLVINLLFWAGAETQLRNLAIGLSGLGHNVTLLAVEDITSHVDDLEEAGVELQALGAQGRLDKVRALPTLVRAARRAEVVHCTGWDASLWGRLASILARRPVVVTEHAGDRSLQVSKKGAPRARLIALHNRLLDRATSATVVVSSAQPKQLETEGVRPDSIVLIPNGVPIEELRQRAGEGCDRAELGIPPDATMIVHVARFAPPKRQATTLRVVSRLRERFGDVRLVFAGDGETEDAVKREAGEMGAEWATFLGSRDDVPALLRSADLAVLPSSAEGLPMSLIEALAVGTPVVATDVGDVPWLLGEVGGGLCVASGDEEAFTQACARVLAEPSLDERLRREGMTGLGNFDAMRMVERYSDLMEAAIESRAPSSVLEEPALEA